MRQWCVLLAGVTLVGTPLSLKAGVVESYESGVGNVTLDAGENSPTVEQSPLFATDGVSSAKFTLNGDWLWRWNTHNVLPALEDVASSQYLVFDFTVASGQFKLGGIAANGNGGWKQQGCLERRAYAARRRWTDLKFADLRRRREPRLRHLRCRRHRDVRLGLRGRGLCSCSWGYVSPIRPQSAGACRFGHSSRQFARHWECTAAAAVRCYEAVLVGDAG